MSNREIKFRAWDKENKVMSEGLPLEWFITGDPVDMEFPKTKESLPLNDFREYLNDFVIMQYTGLKDKNDKEIYEGDILFDNSKDYGGNKIVIWNKGQAKFELNHMLGHSLLQKEFIEIIGNIYENI